MEYVFYILNTILILSVFAISLNLLLGYTGQLSMASAALGGVGGYLTGWLAINYGLTFIPALFVAVTSGAILGILIGVIAMRISQEYLVILTVAFATAIIALIIVIPGLGGIQALIRIPVISIFGIELTHTWQQAPLIALPVVLTIFICWRLGESPYGRLLKSVRDDESAVSSVGKSPFTSKITIFAITSALAAVVGPMMAYTNQVLAPSYFDMSKLVQIIGAMVLGGLGNIFGPVVGSTIVGAFYPLAQRLALVDPTTMGQLRVIIYGALLIFVLRAMPQGLLKEGMSVTNWVRRLARHKTGPERRTIERGELSIKPRATDETLLPVTSPSKVDEGAVALKMDGLVKHFGGIVAVGGLDLQLKDRQIAALIGPNGAGKTTIFNLITGVLPADKGKVYLRGEDITGWVPNRIAKAGMVRTFQDVRLFYRTSALENVMVAMQNVPGEHLGSLFLQPKRVRNAENENRQKALDMLNFVGLRGKEDILTGELGFGEQKLVSLARALATGGSIMLLDEPCSGIDRSLMEPIIESILKLPELGKTILVVEHNLDVVRGLGCHVYFLEQGRLTAEGTMDELTSQQRLAESYFGSMS